MTTETGPIYGVPLIDTLPLNETGTLRQQMPMRKDLILCNHSHSRVANGYEVLLAHYRKVCEERDRLRQQVRDFVVDNEFRKMETGL